MNRVKVNDPLDRFVWTSYFTWNTCSLQNAELFQRNGAVVGVLASKIPLPANWIRIIALG